MAEGNPIISFHNKQMNPLEAKLYLWGLKFGIIKPKLIGEEEYDYLKWKYIEKCREERATTLIGNKINKEPTKKEYLINILEREINTAKTLETAKYCEIHGHKEEKDSAYTPPGIEGAVTHYTCSRCGITYEKKSTCDD